ncbi:unnamed protein product, partial [Mesorhabditis spiculigera]
MENNQAANSRRGSVKRRVRRDSSVSSTKSRRGDGDEDVYSTSSYSESAASCEDLQNLSLGNNFCEISGDFDLSINMDNWATNSDDFAPPPVLDMGYVPELSNSVLALINDYSGKQIDIESTLTQESANASEGHGLQSTNNTAQGNGSGIPTTTPFDQLPNPPMAQIDGTSLWANHPFPTTGMASDGPNFHELQPASYGYGGNRNDHLLYVDKMEGDVPFPPVSQSNGDQYMIYYDEGGCFAPYPANASNAPIYSADDSTDNEQIRPEIAEPAGRRRRGRPAVYAIDPQRLTPAQKTEYDRIWRDKASDPSFSDKPEEEKIKIVIDRMRNNYSVAESRKNKVQFHAKERELLHTLKEHILSERSPECELRRQLRTMIHEWEEDNCQGNNRVSLSNGGSQRRRNN